MNPRPSTVFLYCFSHAGGSAQTFRSWQRTFPDGIQIKGVERPGRGKRSGEKLVDDHELLVDMLTDEIAEDIVRAKRAIGEVHYAVFGHSTGAALGFSVSTRLASRLSKPPKHCFFAAGQPPHTEKRRYSVMSDEQLADEVRRLAGTPSAVVNNAEVLGFSLPMLRADLSCHEKSGVDAGKKVDSPMTLFTANGDVLAPEVVWSWAQYTSYLVRRVPLKGDHLSIVRSPVELIGHVRDILEREMGLATPMGRM